MKIDYECRSEAAGFFKLEVFDAKTGRKTKQTPWFKNLITNTGLNQMATHLSTTSLAPFSYCHVGTGSAAPSFSDTALSTWVAASSSVTGISGGAQSSTPYYIHIRRRFNFGEGDAAGILAEVGIGPSSSNETLTSRALIVDELGDPTTIQILSNEFLRVTYEFRIYIPTTDLSDSLTIDGIATDWVARALAVTTYTTLANASGWGFNGARVANIAPRVADDDIGDLDDPYSAMPSVTVPVAGWTVDAYVTDSHEVTASFLVDLEAANDMTIRVFRFRLGWGSWQISFDPGIAKDNTIRITFNVKHTWSRRTI